MKIAQYYRKPTSFEVTRGYGATHYLDIKEVDFLEFNCIKKNGDLKKWFVSAFDGLRYYLIF